jgi:glycosyltransferase involved in cell wall biosynthesis
MSISVYIITFNEADKISDCIKTVLWADEIIVADSNSSDDTVEIAKKLGAKVINMPFNGFGDLRNKAISHCKNEWILSLDSDERCTIDLRNEVLSIIQSTPLDIFRIPRKNFFMGKWIKFSGWYPNYRQPQLFRNGKMSYTMDTVHEGYINLGHKNIGVIKNSIWQIPFKNIEEMIEKANRYSTLGIDKLNKKQKKSSYFKAFSHGFWSFFKHYIFKLGFLDGGPGFIIALGNFEGTFYRYIKLLESQEKWETPSVQPIYKPKK